MKLKIIDVLIPTNEQWDNIWQDCEYATYFHSREWADIWHDYTNGKIIPSPKLLLFNDKKKVLLPFSFKTSFKGLVKKHVSSPAGTFGGWITTENLEKEHIKILVRYLNKKFGDLTWRVNPFDKSASLIMLKKNKNDFTQALDLGKGFTKILKNLSKGHLSAVNKAKKSGVSVKVAFLLKDWECYFEVYKDSIQRWGDKVSSKYNWEFFYNIYKRESPNIKLWLAIYNQKIIAGALCFYSKKHVVYWHGAAFEKYFYLRPVNLLITEIIRHAGDNGYKWFDFNPSGGHKGVVKFKKSFGAEKLSSPIIENISRKSKILSWLSKLKNSTG